MLHKSSRTFPIKQQLVSCWRKVFGGYPCHFPFVCPTPGGLEGPAHSPCSPTGPKPGCHSKQLWTVTPTVGRHSLEPHTDERAELDVHLHVCSVMGHIHRLHSLGGHSCHTGAPAASPGARPHPWPCLPDRAAPPGSELCHLHPTWGRGTQSCQMCRPGLLSPSMLLPGPLPGWGPGAQLPVCLTQHQARIHRVEVSLHLPACCLEVVGRERQAQRGRFQVKATGPKSVHITTP